jgi:ketosteroid isomerase-like protein
MAIFDPAVRFEFQGAADGGITELRQSYKDGFAQQQGASWTPKWDQVLVSGDLAAAFSTWTAEVRKADGTSKVLITAASMCSGAAPIALGESCAR